jgi:hypothetical protein
MRDPTSRSSSASMSARIDAELAIGEPCVVAAWPLGGEGRKRFAGTALYSATGTPIAVARATWIEIATCRRRFLSRAGSGRLLRARFLAQAAAPFAAPCRWSSSARRR